MSTHPNNMHKKKGVEPKSMHIPFKFSTTEKMDTPDHIGVANDFCFENQSEKARSAVCKQHVYSKITTGL